MSLHLCISGFDTKTLSVTGLEEYWPYKFKVTAATVKGDNTSDFSSVFRTKQAGNSFYCHVLVCLDDVGRSFAILLWVYVSSPCESF